MEALPFTTISSLLPHPQKTKKQPLNLGNGSVVQQMKWKIEWVTGRKDRVIKEGWTGDGGHV